MKTKFFLYYINTIPLQYYKVVELKDEDIVEFEFNNIKLTRKQFQLLNLLCNKKEWVSIEEVLEEMYREKIDFSSSYHEFLYHSFRVHLCTLRTLASF